ncbi:MAG: extracellular solute-binding protein [Candidatus Rokubacteria bacterium]|nr:extracellular solute-binding protein [Candidatus Rokubacteria bacterium]
MHIKAGALFLILVTLSLLALFGTVAAQSPETLRVALYPYVPKGRELFFKLEAAFEAAHPGVNVELVESKPLLEDYYKDGLLKADADIYEIDTVLLPDMIRAGKIAPLTLPNADFVPEARQAVQFNGSTWAVPHWICGNFLFYAKGDEAVKKAKTWEELVAAFGANTAWFVDLKGTSTLGEWYLTVIAGLDGDAASVLNRLQSSSLDPAAIQKLQALLGPCPAGYCRSRALHDRTGYYARQFARGRARAYIGYSETLHYALQEIADNCGVTDGCRRADEIAVRALPVLLPQGKPVGWVDGLGISAALTGRKKDLAREFIEFAASWQAYQLILNTETGTAPRYLLPALRLSTRNPELDPPLYKTLYAAFGMRLILTAEGLNKALRDRGEALDCVLPPERGDAKWAQRCQNVSSPSPRQ